MKKFILCILTTIFLTIGCTNEEVNNFTNIIGDSLNNMKTPDYVDTNPIKIGLYQNSKLVKELHTNFQDKKDIAVLNIFYSNDENLDSNNLKSNWNKYYKQYENIDNYKIGFYVTFKANDKEYENLLLDPSNQHKLHPYLYLYLYDGIHQTGRYSHLKKEDISDETIYTTIKLYMHLNSNEITSPITLSVFTYKDENDFLNNKYRGNSIYTIKIFNK